MIKKVQLPKNNTVTNLVFFIPYGLSKWHKSRRISKGMESDSSLIYEYKRLISIADRTNNSNSMKI